jgi:inhibitor of KinA
LANPGPASGERWPTFAPVADHALLVSFGDAISDATSAEVLALDHALADAPPTGFAECVPAFVNLLIDFDPLQTDHAQLRRDVERLLRSPVRGHATGQWREVEVCYEHEFAPDVAAVAASTGLSVNEVISCHLEADYQVRMYGFAPGYAYMSGVPLAIQVPRKPAAVRDIPAGSVLVAGPQCLVTTLTMPTGWSIIGRSPTRILGRDERAPFLFDVGDQVRFKRLDRAQFETRIRAARDE